MPVATRSAPAALLALALSSAIAVFALLTSQVWMAAAAAVGAVATAGLWRAARRTAAALEAARATVDAGLAVQARADAAAAAAGQRAALADAQTRAVLDALPLFVAVLRADGTILRINDAPLSEVGLAADDVVGRRLWETPWWQQLPAQQHTLAGAVERAVAGERVRLDLVTDCGGGPATFDFSLTPTAGGAADAAALIVAGMDVTARRAVEASVQSSEALARARLDEIEAIYDAAPIGLCVIDRELRWRRINRQLAEINGLAVEAHLGRSVRELLPAVADAAEPLLRRVLDTGEPLTNIEITGSTPARPGEQRVWREAFHPLRDHTGQVVGLNVVCEDITERKHMEHALQASERLARERAEELHSVMQAAPIALLIAHDGAGRHVSGNAEAHRLLRSEPGRPLAGDGGPGVTEWHGGERLQADALPLARALAGAAEVRNFDMTLAFADGEARHVVANAVPLRHPDGTVRGAVAAFGDITALKRAEDALREADRRKDQFLAMLAHELRNPLAPIRNAVHIMRAVGPAEPTLVKTREMIGRQVEHLARLVDDLLDISRITQGKVTLRQQQVAVRDVLHQALEAARPLIDASHHELQLLVPEEPLWVLGDEVRLAQVVTNVLNNAAKYTPDGGRITVRVAREQREVVIEVTDTGIGIPRALLPHVFDLFIQADHSLDRAKGGLGIGLSLVRRLVELHNGRVEAASDGPGLGSRFTLRLPLLAVYERPQRAAPDAALPDGVRRRVLVVDDNVDAADSMATLVRLEGHDARTAVDGLTALAAMRDFQPDVVLLDIGLPGMDGYEVARRLRLVDETRVPTIIALTGYGQAEDVQRSRAAGFNDHLVKPVDPHRLFALIAAAPAH